MVIGAQSEKALATLRRLYREMGIDNARIVATELRSAELIKYAANGFLATKIAFINEIADLCENVDAKVADVAMGIGLDRRIGRQFLDAGPGFGGSCFPKDARALARIGEDHGTPMRIIEAVLASNNLRKQSIAGKVRAAGGGDLRGKTVALFGLTFKPGTDAKHFASNCTPALNSCCRGGCEGFPATSTSMGMSTSMGIITITTTIIMDMIITSSV